MRILLVLLSLTLLDHASGQNNLGRPLEIAIASQDFPNPAFRFAFGHTIAVDRDTASIRLYGTKGQDLFTKSLILPGVFKLRIRDAAVSPVGGVAVAASAMNDGGTLASLVVLLDSGGRISRVVHTNPYVPIHIAYAQDGTLWAAGRVNDDSLKELATYDIVKRYDSQGVEIGSGLPKSAFRPGGHEHPAIGSFFMIRESGMALYSPGANSYVKFSAHGTIESISSTGAFPETFMVHGATAIGDVLFVSAQAAQGELPRMRLFRSDDSTTWTPVKTDELTKPETGASLIGMHDGKLVFLSANKLLFTSPAGR